MTLDWKHEAIDQLDWHWQNQLRPRLERLTDDEYFWEPVKGCWSLHPRDEARTALQAGKGDLVFDYEVPEPDPAPLTTIAWRLNHISAMCLGVRAANHFGDPWDEAWWTDYEWPATAADALAELDRYYDAWMSGLKSLDDAGMARPVGPAEGGWHASPMGGLVLHNHREVIHHGAEIALLRDLYRARFAR